MLQSKDNNIKIYNTLTKNNYNLDSCISKDFMKILNKEIKDSYIKIRNKKFDYIPKKVKPEEVCDLTTEFYRSIYGEKITERLNEFYAKTFFTVNFDYVNANACAMQSYNIKNLKVSNFLIDYTKDIITCYLLVHEYGHAMYLPPRKFIYNEVISMTLQRIFSNLNYKELELLQSRQGIESSFFSSIDYFTILFKEKNEKLKKADYYVSQVYLVGYIASLYLLDYYKQDSNTFKRIINNDFGSETKANDIIDYYGIKLESYKTLEILDRDMQKVLKKTSS